MVSLTGDREAGGKAVALRNGLLSDLFSAFLLDFSLVGLVNFGFVEAFSDVELLRFAEPTRSACSSQTKVT